MSYPKIKLIDCPRDAIQGLHDFIPTHKKIAYINKVLASNLFEYIDFGSFVSPKAVPQMQDTAALLEGIHKDNNTKLLAIIANEKGAEIASKYDKIDYLGYPFSISETFQRRNANSSIAESFDRVLHIMDKISNGNQELVIYLSMAFGNPYGDHWHPELVLGWADKLKTLGIKRFSLADTTAQASSFEVKELFTLVKDTHEELDLGIHLHAHPQSALLKIEAAYEAGCTRFEGAMMGYGGCPFANDDLVGNIPMEMLLDRFEKGDSDLRLSLLQSFDDLINNDAV